MPDLTAIRWIVTVFIGVIGIWVIVGNLACVGVSLFRHRHVSLVLLVGGLLTSISLLVCPIREVSRLAWLPLIIDPGCALVFIPLLYAVVVRWCFNSK